MVKLTKILTLIMLSCLPAIGLAATAQPASVQKIVVFVPGFFNSFAPEYFSYDIVKTMQTKGFVVVVAQKLNPIGTIQDNGERVYQLFQNIRAQNPKAEINVIGHSAGGLYALYAINKGAHYIKNLITVSTPFNGVEFVENWRENSWAFSELMRWSYLDGLRQLTTPFVQNFLKTVRVPPSLRIMAYGGYQPVNFDITNAANMTAVLSVTDQFITGASDGIVSFQSALMTTYITTTQKTLLKVHTDRTYYIPLEHWEQVLDYRNFVLLGVRNTTLIRDRQVQFYSGIANMLQLL
jgi:triacylglycerol esterase/lipase EstA (alpha/beta hydrolase family)